MPSSPATPEEADVSHPVLKALVGANGLVEVVNGAVHGGVNLVGHLEDEREDRDHCRAYQVDSSARCKRFFRGDAFFCPFFCADYADRNARVTSTKSLLIRFLQVRGEAISLCLTTAISMLVKASSHRQTL